MPLASDNLRAAASAPARPVEFLVGPAGCGKTRRCLEEIRRALVTQPEGAPLLFLAPKQATFQLERQLLADTSLKGYTRLQILSFERLAEFVLRSRRRPNPNWLSEEGRVMVLRSLLTQKREHMKLFRASARLPGFAQQLSGLLREFQRYHQTPNRLERLGRDLQSDRALSHKLHDLALILRSYQDWLLEHELRDTDELLDAAAEELLEDWPGGIGVDPLQFDGLWLDGFAEMTPQEQTLLFRLIPYCRRATLAFCLETPTDGEGSWLSTWAPVSQTFHRCRQQIGGLEGCRVTVTRLPRDSRRGRFAGAEVLQHLEEHWTRPRPYSSGIASNESGPGLRFVQCANPEQEAIVAAREIRRFVREQDGRYREAAVILRRFEGYHDILRRVFDRYQIPYFMDRREPVAHHPLAELTRYALRTVTYAWRHEDWFGALKTGLVPLAETDIDRLENEALARGWTEAFWRHDPGDPDDPILDQRLGRVRRNVLPAFETLAAQIGGAPGGKQLAEGIRRFWEQLRVDSTLDQWARSDPLSESEAARRRHSEVHTTVWQQMNAWLDNLALAFPTETASLREWLAVLETGLAGLTVGVIPPALDQVLIGAIDRSRNPDLRLTLVLGLNEGVFPALPDAGGLLTETDRERLEEKGMNLGPNRRAQLGRERYYGYIACTRSRERLVLTWAGRDEKNRSLNPSSLVDHVRRLFPELSTDKASSNPDWRESDHVSELAGSMLARMLGSCSEEQALSAAGFASEVEPLPDGALSALSDLPQFEQWRRQLEPLTAYTSGGQLSPHMAEALYGPVLRTAVSRLEQFAACPFQFFVSAGLRAEERRLFELDAREQGSFQHAVLAQFHESLRNEGKQWRDLTPAEARRRVGEVAEDVAGEFRDGLLYADDKSRFTARQLTESLQNFVETFVGWLPQYEFDPVAVELSFGLPESPLPAWTLDLGEGRQLAFRGMIDRVDLETGLDPDGKQGARCVVIDYKSSARKLDPLLMTHGVQLQLPAYLSVLRHLPDPRTVLGVSALIPAGVFYVNLRGHYRNGAHRGEVLADPLTLRRKAYQHTGMFDRAILHRLDNRPDAKTGDQFKYKLKKDGEPYQNSRKVYGSTEFLATLDHVEETLRQFGQRIFAGEATVDPYQRKKDRPCQRCTYQAVCRIDPWTHAYRILK